MKRKPKTVGPRSRSSKKRAPRTERKSAQQRRAAQRRGAKRTEAERRGDKHSEAERSAAQHSEAESSGEFHEKVLTSGNVGEVIEDVQTAVPTAAADAPAEASPAAASDAPQFNHSYTVRLDDEGHELLTRLARMHYVPPGLYLRQILMPHLRKLAREADETAQGGQEGRS